MQSIFSTLGTGFDLLLVVLGFGLIIFFHELGHFLAARWARIRVLAFAVGFGPALLSYRRGLGLRRGSSVAEVQRIAEERGVAKPGRPPVVPGISPTEYRLNVLPFGGYVKMLGQDDADPAARSDEPDGYQATPAWKRMIVISAGVIANFGLAAILFVCVFMLGLTTEPATVGAVDFGSPAAKAVAINAKELNIQEPGLQPGDKILAINGDAPDDFSEVVVATAMARKGRALRFEVERAGVREPLKFDIVPTEDLTTRLLQVGVGPSVSDVVAYQGFTPEGREEFLKLLERQGLKGVKPEMRLATVAGQKAGSAYDIDAAARRSGGTPFEVVFSSTPERSDTATVTVTPRRRLERERFWPARDRVFSGSHLLGLTPVMAAGGVVENGAAEKAGVKAGDIFVQIGSVEWPSVPEGISEITGSKGGTVKIVVHRTIDGVAREVDLGEVPVGRDGRIGIGVDEALNETRVTTWPAKFVEAEDKAAAPSPAAVGLGLMRGSRILEVNGTPVTTFESIAAALIEHTKAAGPSESVTITITVELPIRKDEPSEDTVRWTLDPKAIQALRTLPWTSPIPTGIFEREEITLKADSPSEALAMGLRRTHRVMMQTYLTFSRLFQGTVKVEHLRGPVGIAHMGTIVASRGFVHLLFFMALISVNLGVVNFLPVPIADGGHFLFLLYEQITGKPVSVAVQNIAALAGLVLIAGMFLLVTYNDIANLFS